MSLAYFYGFLDGRIRQSGSLPAGHWLLEARLSALSVLAFVVELGVNQRLEEHIAQSHRPEPIALYGKTGQRRIHRATASKMIMLRRLLDGHGSREAVGRALTDGNRGIGAQYQGVQNACYSETARRAFHSTRRLAVNWDGSTHGGLDMNVGFAVDVGTGFGAYFRPLVPHIFLTFFLEQGPQASRMSLGSCVQAPTVRSNNLFYMGTHLWHPMGHLKH